MKQRWRVLGGIAAGGAGLFAFGTAVAGIHSIEQYIKILRDPYINFTTDMMPNLHGLAVSLKAGALLEIGLSGALVLAFLWICRKTANYELLFALAMLCSLLVSFHSGIGDDILLLPIFVLVLSSTEYKPLRLAMAAVMTPIPYFLGASISIVIPLLLLLVFVLGVASLVRRQDAVGIVSATSPTAA
jgi:hypothetical protein